MTPSLPSRAARLLPALLILNACSSSDRPTAPRVGQEALMRPGPPPANPAIAFTAGQTTLWVMNADGSNQTQITSTVGSLASWAPFGDGTPANPYAIAYEPSGCQLSRIDVAVVNGVPQGSNVRSLSVAPSACGLDPAWSPKGDTIAFGDAGNNSPSSLWLTPADGSGPAVPIYTAPSRNRVVWSAWRSDASQIAFVEQDALGNRGIKVLNRATSVVTTVLAAGVLAGPRFVDWARTKDVLAFDAQGPRQDSLYTLDIASGHLTQIVPGVFPTWSPDDSKLAFAGISVVDVATRTVTRLAKGGTWPDWRR